MNIKNAVWNMAAWKIPMRVARALRCARLGLSLTMRRKTVDLQGISDFPTDHGQNMTGKTIDRSGTSGFVAVRKRRPSAGSFVFFVPFSRISRLKIRFSICGQEFVQFVSLFPSQTFPD
jgi:hypothetical protein